MLPRRDPQATVEDLLERVLDKGIVLKLDLVVGVAGIPLIGISLHGAIAAIETMLDYGMMQPWDADTRSYAGRETQRRQLDLEPGEHRVLELYGSHRHALGISRAWRPGRLVLTDRRLLLLRAAPWEILFETPLSAIAGLGRGTCRNVGGGQREVFSVALADGTVAAIYAAAPDTFETSIKDLLQRLGRDVADISPACIERFDPDAVAEGQLWHRWVPGHGDAFWKSGWAVLTEAELTWRPDREDTAGHTLLRVPVSHIRARAVERRELGVLGERDVLVVAYDADGHCGEALFAGPAIGAWSAAIRPAWPPVDGGGDA